MESMAIYGFQPHLWQKSEFADVVEMYDNPLSVAIVNSTEAEEGESKKAMSLIEPAFLDQEMYRDDRLFRDVALYMFMTPCEEPIKRSL